MKFPTPAMLLFCVSAFACQQPAESPQSARSRQKTAAEDAIMVFTSVDGGAHWQDISAGLPKPVKDSAETRRNIAFADQTGLYLTDGNGLYHHAPGATAPFWTKESIPDENISITPGTSGIIAYHYRGGIVQKTATGQWTPIQTDFPHKNVLFVFESAAGSMFIGTEGGLYKSTDQGKTWKHIRVHGLIVKVAESEGVLMAINTAGITRSTDDGETWDLVVDEQRRGFVVEGIRGGFAVGFDKTAKETRKVRTSYDGGQSWASIDAGLPASANIASLIQVGESFFCSHPKGIYRTTDRGNTWELLLPSVQDKVFDLSASGNVIYAIARKKGC
jgi:photosystem II stability/assembly factor-like uncharacterized protein